jgi:cell division protein FtsI (penicillin-binding protein 3)
MTVRRSDSGLGAARAYHPRGRTVRDRHRPTATVERDPLRSALKVFDDKPAARPARKATGAPASRTRAAAPRQPAPAKAAAKGSPSRKVTKPTKASKASKPSKPRRPPALASPRRRLRLATVLTLSLFAVLGLRLVELQLTDGPAYAAEGLQDRLTEVTLPAERGAIYDRNGNVLAHSVEARFVYADPPRVTDPPRVAAELQPLLGIPASDLLELMRPTTLEDGTQSRFAWLARGVDIATADAIMALNLPGINVDRDERRIVPGNDLAANLIGFTGEDLAGLEGLEAAYDDVLRGVDGERIYESGQGASLDRPIPGGYEVETPPQPGSDLRLTIDMDLQYEVQRVLAEQLRERNASFGAAVVLDTHTGEVLAQASYPTYNAADPLAASESARVDAATATVFDPGSAHKPFVLGAALQEGVIAPGDSVVINPSIVKGDRTFSDVIWHPPGTRLGLSGVLAFSSNVGTIMIADELGPEKLYEYQQAFGLGTPTGIGVPGEASGALLAPEDWYASSYGSVPIGHSVDVTTLQMAAAYGTIANDGVYVQPRLLQAVVGPDGSEEAAGDPVTRQVLSPENAAYLRELMEAVTTVPGATGLNAAIEGYRVAGKTGTGSLVTDGEYADGEVASFVGMAPAEAPRYVIAVVAHTPGGGGGEVTSPAFQEMMAFTLNHYRVPPSATEPPAFDLYPSAGR